MRSLPPQTELDRDGIFAVKLVGAGQFGEVYLGNRTMRDGKDVPCAVKVLIKPNDASGAETEQVLKAKAEFMGEARCLLALRGHPSIVSLFGVCMAQEPCMLVTEFIEYGDLKKLLVACYDKQAWCSRLCDAPHPHGADAAAPQDLRARNGTSATAGRGSARLYAQPPLRAH